MVSTPFFNAGGWVALHRGERLIELLRNPNAFALLALVAVRARWQDGDSLYGLTCGQALLGDHAACGLSRREYRTALDNLVRWGFLKVNPTPRGTVATLVDKSVFSLTAGEPTKIDHQYGHQSGQQQDAGNDAEIPAGLHNSCAPVAASANETANTLTSDRPSTGQQPATNVQGYKETRRILQPLRGGQREVAMNLERGGAEIKTALHDGNQNPVEIMLQFVGESDNDQTRGFLAHVRGKAGETSFRQECEAFVAEIAAGEEPKHRGRALTARLTKLIQSKP